MEQTLFGINLILILIFQEKDSIKGEIKYSVIPLALNNIYMFVTNFKSLAHKNEQEVRQPRDGVPSSPSSA